MVQSGNNVDRAIQMAIQQNPSFGINRILASVRRDGFRIANTRGRNLIRLYRQALDDTIDGTGSAGGIQIPSDHILEGINDDLVEQFQRDIVRSNEVFHTRGGRYDRVSDFTHILVRWAGSATVEFYGQGGVQVGGFTEDFQGQFTQPLAGYSEENIADRISDQLRRTAFQRFNQRAFGVPETDPRGIIAVVSDLRFRITDLEGRGSAGR